MEDTSFSDSMSILGYTFLYAVIFVGAMVVGKRGYLRFFYHNPVEDGFFLTPPVVTPYETIAPIVHSTRPLLAQPPITQHSILNMDDFEVFARNLDEDNSSESEDEFERLN